MHSIGKGIAINYSLLIGFLAIAISLFGCTTNASDLIRQQRIEESPQWNGESFQNPERVPDVEWGPSLKMFWNYFVNKPDGFVPDPALPAETLDVLLWNDQKDFQFAWLGHTTFLIKIDDKNILTDPMFSITHNHPDHLDEDSIKALVSRTRHFVTPLAVGGLLEEWGVSHEKIHELDWWQEKSIDDVVITATPAKHTSERGIFDKNATLWASYCIRGINRNLYLSGDSGWFEGLYEIGERLGPFDVTFFEIGAYSDLKGQMEVHYSPEQAVDAHQAVRGKLIVPSGWGTFDLGLFPWHEPIERFVIAANEAGIDYLTPKIGESVMPGKVGGREAWWKTYVKH
jgi:L-ascorbate metabolism protein UlaG (beta-lactamase superfamily)